MYLQHHAACRNSPPERCAHIYFLSFAVAYPVTFTSQVPQKTAQSEHSTQKTFQSEHSTQKTVQSETSTQKTVLSEECRVKQSLSTLSGMFGGVWSTGSRATVGSICHHPLGLHVPAFTQTKLLGTLLEPLFWEPESAGALDADQWLVCRHH